MDWRTFLLDLINSIAWPIVVVIAVVILRKPLSNLIPLLRKVKYKDFEAEFGDKVAELRPIVKKEIPTPTSYREDRTDQVIEKLMHLTALSPRAVVLESWRDVESSALDAAHRKELKISMAPHPSPVAIGRSLSEAGLIDENKLEIFNKLRSMRNKAVHADDFDMDKDDALEYADMASKISILLKST